MTIVLVTGPPGAGKSTVASLLTQGWERAIHLHTDAIHAWIANGHIQPWLPESFAAFSGRTAVA